MIIIGTYPDGFDPDGTQFALRSLETHLGRLLPKKIGLHILPFYPNSGDHGFAPDEWFQIRSDLGNWNDLSNLAEHWKVLVDGIYNHVGINHRWVKGFLETPDEYADIIHAYKARATDEGPVSPRGQPVLTESVSGYYLWQTFSKAAVDIRLSSRTVQDEINAHLKMLSKHGIWGVRLDAVAYYAKGLGMQIRHNPGVFELANAIADKVQSHGLRVLAQLDCDEDGLRYFSDGARRHIPINDFTYSTYLALSLLEEDPSVLIGHVLRTEKEGRVLIRAPRTHDGILLRSKLLKEQDKRKFIDFAESMNIKVRISGGNPYEINSSAPHLYSLLAGDAELSKVILFTVAVTGMLSGWSYFYLPYIMGHMPEKNHNADYTDPRTLNRTPISKSEFEDFVGSSKSEEITSLLGVLSAIHDAQGDRFRSVPSIEDDLLLLSTIDRKYKMIANFSQTRAHKIPNKWLGGESLISSDFRRGVLGGFGFTIMSIV